MGWFSVAEGGRPSMLVAEVPHIDEGQPTRPASSEIQGLRTDY